MLLLSCMDEGLFSGATVKATTISTQFLMVHMQDSMPVLECRLKKQEQQIINLCSC